MKTAFALAASFALTNAQGLLNQACCNAPIISNACACQQKQMQPSVQQLTQEPQRCGCPMPAPSSACGNSLPVSTQGCGCQPAQCAPQKPLPPKRALPPPTKVLTLQCHDVTTYRTVPIDKSKTIIVYVDEQRTRTVQKPMTTYKKVKAIRYKLQTVTETKMQMSSKMVKKTVNNLQRIAVQVPVHQAARKDCCGRDMNVPMTCQSCQPSMQFVTKYITKDVTSTVEVPENFEVPVEVQVQKQVPYEVEVNEPVVSFEDVTEVYTIKVPKEKAVDYQMTETIPVVTRQCTDALGKIVNQLNQVPLHASGPTRAQLNIESDKEQKSMRAPIMGDQTKANGPVGDPQAELDALRARLSNKASLVLTPLDQQYDPVGLIQVGGVSPRTGRSVIGQHAQQSQSSQQTGSIVSPVQMAPQTSQNACQQVGNLCPYNNGYQSGWAIARPNNFFSSALNNNQVLAEEGHSASGWQTTTGNQ